MEKANIDMICDIAELSSLFEKSESLDDFLQAAVSVVAYHMQAAVCSIYIYDDASERLVLRATQGLKKEAIGSVQLRLGEGLVGLALKELRAIRVGNAIDNPNFRSFEGINEEKYKAFLAVPIRRQLTRVGTLVVQDVKSHYFDKVDENALKAIAAQLASVIENANLLMTIRRNEGVAVPATVGKNVMRLIKGRPASAGVAHGKIHIMVYGRAGRFHPPTSAPKNLSLEDFERAVEKSEDQLKKLQREMAENLSDVAQLIFNAHLLILADPDFTGEICTMIKNGTPPVEALSCVVNRYIDIFSASPNPRLQEKEHDLKDLGHRLLENLIGMGEAPADYSGQIIIADTLLPSDVLKFSTENAAGFVVQGGMTAHIGIICRSLQKPMVMVDTQQFSMLQERTEVMLDGSQGTICINPSKEVINEYDRVRKSVAEMESAPDVSNETYTKDGTRINLFANINLLSDLKVAIKFCSEGVGLYRSEFPFIIRDAFPSEEEQYQVYRRIIETMGEREVTFRALDIGGDKLVAYKNTIEEENPFLGLRGIRFLLRNKDIFAEQICALLRAGAGGNARIMFPLISSIDEFVEARAIVEQCEEELKERGVDYNCDIKLGVMIELPSAVALVEDLAHEVDFMSIGTNDLIQYMLAVDRTNEMVSDLYLSHHPAILRAIERVASVAKSHKVDVSVCGDISRDVKMIPFLLGAGVTKLSVAPRRIPAIQKAIEKISMESAFYTAHQMLKASRISEVEALLHKVEV